MLELERPKSVEALTNENTEGSNKVSELLGMGLFLNVWSINGKGVLAEQS